MAILPSTAEHGLSNRTDTEPVRGSDCVTEQAVCGWSGEWDGERHVECGERVRRRTTDPFTLILYLPSDGRGMRGKHGDGSESASVESEHVVASFPHRTHRMLAGANGRGKKSEGGERRVVRTSGDSQNRPTDREMRRCSKNRECQCLR